MSIDDIFDKIDWNKLEEMNLPGKKEFLEVKEDLEQKRSSVLNTIRTIVEKFVNFLYEKLDAKDNPPTEKPVHLAKKLQLLKNKNVISNLQKIHLNYLWLMGSEGSHNKVEAEGDLKAVFYPFVEIVRWFVAEKLNLVLDATSPAKQVQDEFDGKELKWFWEVGNRPELIHAMDGVLDLKVGMFTDWWDTTNGAPYLILRGFDYVDREYVAELKYVQNFAQWPAMMHAGLVLVEMQEQGPPNPRNVYFWGRKTTGKEHHFAIEANREQDPGSKRPKGMRLSHWLPEDAIDQPDKLSAVIRVRQRQDGKNWRYNFEVAEDFGKPALFSYSPGNPHLLPHYVGVFAKNFNLLTMNFHPQFKAFQLLNG